MQDQLLPPDEKDQSSQPLLTFVKFSNHGLDSGNYDFEALEKERLEEEKRRKQIKEGMLQAQEESKTSNLPRDGYNDPNGSSFIQDQPPKVNFDENPETFAKELEENLKEVEDVPVEKREMADDLSQLFDENIIKHILSTKWQQRVKGFEMANRYTLSILQKSDDVIQVQNVILSVIEEGLMDKVSQRGKNLDPPCESSSYANVRDLHICKSLRKHQTHQRAQKLRKYHCPTAG